MSSSSRPPTAPNLDQVFNRISLGMSKQARLLETLDKHRPNSVTATTTTTISSRKAPPPGPHRRNTTTTNRKDDLDSELNESFRYPGAGVGFVPASSGGGTSSKEDRLLKTRLLGRGSSNGPSQQRRKRAAAVAESESEEELGRSAVGKPKGKKEKRARVEVETEVDVEGEASRGEGEASCEPSREERRGAEPGDGGGDIEEGGKKHGDGAKEGGVPLARADRAGKDQGEKTKRKMKKSKKGGEGS